MMVFDCNEQNHSLDRYMIKMIHLPCAFNPLQFYNVLLDCSKFPYPMQF